MLTISRIIFFDTETTGLECTDCKIIELAMLVVENNKIIEEYDKFVKINEKLPEKIIEITGINDNMLDTYGVGEEILAYDLKDRITPGTVMVAHNAQFDLSFIYQLLKRHFSHEAYRTVSNANWLDTLTVLKDRKPYPHKLSDAVSHYGVGEVNFHRAIDDTKALYQITQKLKDERDDLKQYLNIFGYNPKYGVYADKFPFITYEEQHYKRGLTHPNNILPRKITK